MLKYFNRYYISHRAWDYAPLRPDIFEGRDLNEEWSLDMNMEISRSHTGGKYHERGSTKGEMDAV